MTEKVEPAKEMAVKKGGKNGKEEKERDDIENETEY